MKTTRYFDEQVLRKRPYLTLDLCRAVLQSPLSKVIQPMGGYGSSAGCRTPAGMPRILRVVTLADGDTIHNAFFDRGFREQGE